MNAGLVPPGVGIHDWMAGTAGIMTLAVLAGVDRRRKAVA